MTRLYEEVFTRLEEMAMVVERNLKLPSLESRIAFNPVAVRGEAECCRVAIVYNLQGCGYYNYNDGICFEGPLHDPVTNHLQKVSTNESPHETN